jgi:hypothetical protein
MAVDIAETYKKMFLSLIPGNLVKFAKEKSSSYMDAVKIYLLAWAATFVFSIITLLYVSIQEGFSAAVSGQIGFTIEGPFAIAAFLAVHAIGLAWGLAAVYVAQFAGNYAATGFFNGQGNFESQFRLNMLFSGAIMAISALVSLLAAFLPMLVLPLGAISFLLGIYGLYLLYLAMKSVHKLEATGAVLSALVILFVQMIVYFVLAFFMGVLMVLLGVGGAPPAV